MPLNQTTDAWQLFYFKLFKVALDDLEQDVIDLALQYPQDYKSYPQTQLLASVYESITRKIPANPNAEDLQLSQAPGNAVSNWRRLKQDAPDGYRLFSRFSSRTVPLIVYAWFNDLNRTRNEKAEGDVYETFKRMLMRGEVPTSIQGLLAEHESL
ncbi:type II toxin-antitoxin system YhaV family toxin [Herbaspirillum sp. RTI4]|uniref:type II toxin-antitoxin system YhaV family toxin n=1 Tax=Herbaspirillum sp. RTI4 TaxID=3048640 RepID=UPI002AB558E5|nr:type II toxin-antitoxin system YhaV family toxin [Herbaspirillum sp. RTI4]MDY7578219.1 type II toxin-antitoxin system YhaV family toxin [Herbaspirillum sp. RTI4]MEA9981557.1 type II toxin-antitoxin system YhaV family toxin [Herbaspirillum sp. RTI4]